jgi:hypothetical protein
LLLDKGELLELRGRSVWIAGTDPRRVLRGEPRTDPNALSHEADFRILLCHFPRVLDRLEPGRFELVLAGHMHDGQIALPYPGGKLRLAHPRARYASGVYRSGISHARVGWPRDDLRPVPLRGAARATELVPFAVVTGGQASISADISRATRAMPRSVDGGVGPGRRGVRSRTRAVRWAPPRGRVGASIPDVGRTVQQRVAGYLGSMADVEPESVDVIVDEVGPLA